MSGHPQRLRGVSLFTPFSLVLSLLVLIAGVVLLKRLIYGLGDVSNLSAGYPWGLWVTWDLIIGSALGCGGFAMAMLIYAFNQGHYHPLMRPALVGSLLGYLLAGSAAVIDMGRWWQFYNLLLPWHWNFSSVMLETGLCVTAYMMLLFVEASPMALERFGLERWRKRVASVMWLVISIGILLPFMHQSSLGSILLVVGHKLSPLYNTPWLPLLFVGSVLALGYALVVFEATVVTKSFRLPSEHHLLSRLSQLIGALLAAWLVLRWADLIWRDALGDALAATPLALSFWLENAFALFAAAAFLSPRARRDEVITFLAAVSMMLFAFIYRINAYLIAYTPAVDGYEYFPSVQEILVTMGMVAFEILAYLIIIKTFPVLHFPARKRAHA
jgi:Ni/Fe-hydrogenase subunit HybB-like protein